MNLSIDWDEARSNGSSECSCGWLYAGARTRTFLLTVSAEHLSEHARGER